MMIIMREHEICRIMGWNKWDDEHERCRIMGCNKWHDYNNDLHVGHTVVIPALLTAADSAPDLPTDACFASSLAWFLAWETAFAWPLTIWISELK